MDKKPWKVWRFNLRFSKLRIKPEGDLPVNLTDMLFPQYAYKYENKVDKRLTRDQRTWLIDAARERIKDGKNQDTNQIVMKHWQSIASGKLPFGYRAE